MALRSASHFIRSLSSARLLSAVVLAWFVGCAPPSESPRETPVSVRYHLGDDLRWAQPNWHDADWAETSVRDLPDAPSVLWLRIDQPVGAVETLGLSVAGVVAREIYWDGTLVGSSGRVGTDRNSELPGPIDAVFRIPDSLSSPGNHVVAVRISSFRRPSRASGLLMQFVVGDYTELSTQPLRSVGIPLLFLGGFVLVAIYYGALYFVDQRRLPYLLTALLCGAVAVLLIAESWRDAIGYTYDLHVFRLDIIDAFTGIVGLLLCATFSVQFNLPRRQFLLAILAIALAAAVILVRDHEAGTYSAFFVALLVALCVTGWASIRKQRGALLALLGIVICFGALLIAKLEFMEAAFFPAFGVLVGGLLLSVGMQTRDDRRRHAAAIATASRLEAELLKKHLQPHFLMNTLTSVMELVETEPARGARAIEALTTELRTLTDVSGDRLIPMARELALCRAHLEVTAFRRGVEFDLVVDDVDPSAAIPPAVIHTLIENAITHNRYAHGNVTFSLRESRTTDVRRLVLATPIAGLERETEKCRPVAGPQRRESEGTGLQYVRARLEEAAPGQWSLAHGPKDGHWVTEISLPWSLQLPPSQSLSE